MSADDEADLSPSLSAKYESPAKAKREALKQKLQREGFNNEAKEQGAGLQSLKLSVLKAQVAGKKDEQAKKDQESKNTPSQSFGTKTREQEIEAQKLSADTTFSTDQMIQQGKLAEDAKEEMQQQGDIQPEGG